MPQGWMPPPCPSWCLNLPNAISPAPSPTRIAMKNDAEYDMTASINKYETNPWNMKSTPRGKSTARRNGGARCAPASTAGRAAWSLPSSVSIELERERVAALRTSAARWAHADSAALETTASRREKAARKKIGRASCRERVS